MSKCACCREEFNKLLNYKGYKVCSACYIGYVNKVKVCENNAKYETEIDELKQQLEEKDKEIECWKDKTKNKILNMKTTDFVKMCLSCGIMVDIKQTQTQLAIQELEKVKNFICDYSEITGQAWNHTLRFLNNKIKELKGESHA